MKNNSGRCRTRSLCNLLPFGDSNDRKSDMSNMNASEMHDMPGMGNEGSAHAMQSMEGRHMDMGPHMKMTTMRDLKPGDQEKADQVVEAARKVAENMWTTKLPWPMASRFSAQPAAEAISLYKLLVRLRGEHAVQSRPSHFTAI